MSVETTPRTLSPSAGEAMGSTQTEHWSKSAWFSEWLYLARENYHGVIYDERDPRHPRNVLLTRRPQDTPLK